MRARTRCPRARRRRSVSSASGRDAVDRGILLAQRAGGRVARVHEHAEAGLGALLVEPREGRERQVDLAAHLDERRRASSPARRSGSASIVRRLAVTSSPIRPSPRVAPRASDAVAIDERDREPVDLRLGDVGDVVVEPALGEQAPRARVPGGQLVAIARVGEREHRLQVLGGREPLGGARADALRRRVGRCAARAAAPRAPPARGRARRTPRPRSPARRARGRAADGASSSLCSHAARSRVGRRQPSAERMSASSAGVVAIASGSTAARPS